MRYQIHHTTEYVYDEAVVLQPHVVRLRPRCDGNQTLESFSLKVTPTPKQQSAVIDLDGNTTLKLWFDSEPTSSFVLQAVSQVATHCTNPFDYLLEPWVIKLPPDYPTSLYLQLKPYLMGQYSSSESIDPVAAQLAQDIWLKAGGNPASFLMVLNDQIYKHCQYMVRETGEPLPPGVTWTHRSGSCRDFAVLFVEACRAMGLAARFVSGYQEGDPDNPERHLHAWAEVFLPGAGWRGYDPTQGLAVSDRHIALVASAAASYTTPVVGAIAPGGAKSTLSYQLTIQPLTSI